MRVLVTGANGLLGRQVVRTLLDRGHDVRAMVRPATDLGNLDWPASVEIVRTDLRASGDLTGAFKGIDTLIHLAAAVQGGEDAQLAAAVVGTERLLGAMAATETRRLVFASSFSIYDWRVTRGELTEDSPVESAPDLYDRDGYAIAKLWQERVVRRASAEHGWDLVTLRPGFIWGCGNEYLACLGQRFGRFHLVIAPLARIPLTYVENCAEMFVLAAEDSRASGETFNVVDGTDVSAWRYLGDHLRSRGEQGIRIPIPYKLGYLGALLATFISKRLFSGKGKLPSLLVPCRFEARFKPIRSPNRKAREILNWRPRLDYAACLQRTYGMPRNIVGTDPIEAPITRHFSERVITDA
ncbi:NAD(P)-dependent oxidoreductase [Singulisphaera sp. Ch08]|uniref:NAD(P)-dependent oxidoreductase n=1 Tax=Singulisphaera sp. Ch08 TaxID=3120278 RepID=A0AAU7CEA1_9BACT